MIRKRISLVLSLTGILSPFCKAFENTKVLPKNIRSLQLRTLKTQIEAKTDETGVSSALASALEKKLKFQDILDTQESEAKKQELLALMKEESFKSQDFLGQFKAQMLGQVRVDIPVFSYGLSKKTTLALAVPFFKARMNTELAFKISKTGKNFVQTLANSNYNLTQSAREAAYKLNNAVNLFQDKLAQLNYEPLSDWQGSGLGDINLLAKTRQLETKHLIVATTVGMSLPSGRRKSADHLADIPFGTGHLSLYSSVILDEPLAFGFVLNQYVKYKHSLQAEEAVRMKTLENPLSAQTKILNKKRGSELELGGSIQYEPSFGITAGLGLSHEAKEKDYYQIKEEASLLAIEKGTNTRRQFVEAKLGYSGIEAYKRGSLPIPFSLEWTYKKHLKSINQTNNDFFQADMALYF